MSEAKLLSPEDLEAGLGFAARQYPGAAKSIRDHIAALEADNAALLNAALSVYDTAKRCHWDEAADESAETAVWSAILHSACAPHPGAALLEGHRKALEARDVLWREYKASKDADVAAWKKERDDAISALEPLQGVASALAEEMERAVDAKERPKGGQQVPFHGDFASCPPSMVGRLKWWARELRTALAGAHGKALVRARNEGLEKAAKRGEWFCEKYAIGEQVAPRNVVDAIRAMKEPEE